MIWGGSINKSCSKIQNPHFDNFLSNDETDKAVSVNTAPLHTWKLALESKPECGDISERSDETDEGEKTWENGAVLQG